MEHYKTCFTCKQTKSTQEFNKRSSRKDGFDSNCRDCANLQKRTWNNANKEKVHAMNKRSYQKNPERAKDAATRWTKKNWDKAYKIRRDYLLRNPGLGASYASARRARKLQNGDFYVRPSFMKKLYLSPCFYCGSKVGIEADHIIPISRGGVHSEGNLVPACKECNRSKHNKLYAEWKLKR